MMSTPEDSGAHSRRSLIAGASAGGLALAVAGLASHTSAQEGALADHPLTGVWLAHANPILPETPQIPHLGIFASDGTCTLFPPVSDIGQAGVTLLTPLIGIWKAYDERRGQFRATQSMSDLTGTVVGVLTVEGFPLVSEDGLSFEDDGEMVIITVQDPFGAVLDSFPGAGGRPVRGNRLTFESMAFPEPLPDSGTPTS